MRKASKLPRDHAPELNLKAGNLVVLNGTMFSWCMLVVDTDCVGVDLVKLWEEIGSGSGGFLPEDFVRRKHFRYTKEGLDLAVHDFGAVIT